MKYEIGNVINSTDNKIPSSKLLFDLKYGDIIIGTCQILIENIFLQFELQGDKGNFSFRPNNESQNSEAVFNRNCLGVNGGMNYEK